MLCFQQWFSNFGMHQTFLGNFQFQRACGSVFLSNTPMLQNRDQILHPLATEWSEPRVLRCPPADANQNQINVWVFISSTKVISPMLNYNHRPKHKQAPRGPESAHVSVCYIHRWALVITFGSWLPEHSFSGKMDIRKSKPSHTREKQGLGLTFPKAGISVS